MSILSLTDLFAFIVYFRAIATFLNANDKALSELAASATAAAAVIGAMGLVVAAVAAAAAVGQLKSQEETAQAALIQVKLQAEFAQKQWEIEVRTSSRDCLWRFTDQWRQVIAKRDDKNSSHWIRAREALTSTSWEHKVDPPEFKGETDHDVVLVLNFFESVAYMCLHGQLERELAWSAFSGNVNRFSVMSRDFIDSFRKGLIKRAKSDSWPITPDFSYWEDFEKWANEMAEYTATRRDAANARPS